ncbi:pyrroline-5-carboxylate reductase [Anaeromyxobacter sp. Fw109-5]|uniref:pyrroline-5-carboxylate reductase n=1 Tax=Anaeromyxobacter sp. (strain Fw109-5) TaxID=404589 RepID=UPI0000ED7CE8|nr:pyrroline-5-carboxylate reductase [Anaeromyxobacter sp. Fw109-5]ABS25594.1 pyrroline-5-carboxylate reductase [Anaeromyxobacter sp. Fw109-5]
MPLGKKIAFLGSGNMAEALVKGLLGAGTASAEEIVCAEPRLERREELALRYGVKVIGSNLEATEQADVVVLSVKPQTMEQLLDEIAPAVDHRKLVVSIAAGVSIAAIARKLGAGVRIVRTMPNTPALVGAGATALARGAHATDWDLEQARSLFQAVGTTVIVEEHHLDAVTGLSGSGPAFLFLVIEALADGGVKVGLARSVAMTLAAQTVLGSAKLVLETGEHPGRLKDQVTSPGGTAIAGVHALEQGGLRAALIAAVEAATRRSRELGERAVRGD